MNMQELDSGSEVWRDIPGYEGLYKASSFGRIRSVPHMGGTALKPHNVVARVLRYRPAASNSRSQGKKAVQSLHKYGEQTTRNWHTWIWAAFNGGFPPPGMCIIHRDGDVDNNRISNLELTTRKVANERIHARRKARALQVTA